MLVLRVPDIVVLKRVHVHVEPAVVVHVHVGNEYCAMSHLYHCRPNAI